MKKFLIVLLAVFSMFASASPAFAQPTPGSANWYNNRSENDCFHNPGYCSARYSGGSSYDRYNDAGYSQPVANNGSAFCIAGIVCVSHSSRHHVGDLCIGPNRSLFGYDDHHHWYRVEGSEMQHEAAGGQYVRCDFGGTSYEGADNAAGGK